MLQFINVIVVQLELAHFTGPILIEHVNGIVYWFSWRPIMLHKFVCTHFKLMQILIRRKEALAKLVELLLNSPAIWSVTRRQRHVRTLLWNPLRASWRQQKWNVWYDLYPYMYIYIYGLTENIHLSLTSGQGLSLLVVHNELDNANFWSW